MCDNNENDFQSQLDTEEKKCNVCHKFHKLRMFYYGFYNGKHAFSKKCFNCKFPNANRIFEENGIKYKKCSACLIIKEINLFYKNKSQKKGLSSNCKICHNIKIKKSKEKNPDEFRRKNRELERKRKAKALEQNPNYWSDFYKENQSSPEYKQKRNKRQRERYVKNREKELKRAKKYRQTLKRKQYINNYSKERKKNDIDFKLKHKLRSRIHHALIGLTKSKPTMELIGCTIEEFKLHIESLFIDNMKWDNYGYGIGKWHLGHIIPCRAFILSLPEHQSICFNYKNIKPQWGDENISINDKLPDGRNARHLTDNERLEYLRSIGFNV